MAKKYNAVKGRVTNNMLEPGPVLTCPICKEPLMRSDIGVHAHLKKHVRAGELDGKDIRATKDKLFR